MKASPGWEEVLWRSQSESLGESGFLTLPQSVGDGKMPSALAGDGEESRAAGWVNRKLV